MTVADSTFPDDPRHPSDSRNLKCDTALRAASVQSHLHGQDPTERDRFHDRRQDAEIKRSRSWDVDDNR